MQSDEEIINGCLKGERFYQDLLYKKYSPVMYGICLRYAADYDAAQDLLQEGFIKVFTKLKSYGGTGSFEGWLKRIFTNNSLDYCRQKQRQNFLVELDDEHDEVDDEPEVVPEISEKKLLEFVQQLPPGYRMVFNLYAIEEHSHREIADMLHVTESTSKTQLLKARKLLSKKVREYLKLIETI